MNNTREVKICPEDSTHGAMQHRTSSYGPFWSCPKRCCTVDAKTGRVKRKSDSTRKRHVVIGKTFKLNGVQAQANLDKKLGGLSDWQSAVIKAGFHRNKVVVAAAGSGKTTTLVSDVGNLIAAGVSPGRIIVTTFTAAGASKLRAALSEVLPFEYLAQVRISTFHSLAGRTLSALDSSRWDERKNHDAKGGFSGDPKKTDMAVWGAKIIMQKIVMKKGKVPGTSFNGLGIRGGDPEKYDRAITIMRAHGVNLQSVDLPEWIKKTEKRFDLVKLETVWKLYESSKKAQGGYDFTDMLYAWAVHLRGSTEFIDSPHCIFVDEAQDNNVVQYALSALLAGACPTCEGTGIYLNDLDLMEEPTQEVCPHCVSLGKYPYAGRVTLVGDPRQSIFGFRGSVPELFLSAARDFHADKYELPVNYRSGKSIVELGNRVVAGYKWAEGEETISGRPDLGEAVAYRVLPACADPFDEARSVIDLIAINVMDKGIVKFQDCAILARTRHRAAMFECAAMIRGLPAYRMEEPSMFERKEVGEFLAFAQLLQHGCEFALAEKAFRTAVNAPEYRAHPGVVMPLFREGWQRFPGNPIASARYVAQTMPSGRDGGRVSDFVDALEYCDESVWSYLPGDEVALEDRAAWLTDIRTRIHHEELKMPAVDVLADVLGKGNRDRAMYIGTVQRIAARFASFPEFMDRYKRYLNADPGKSINIGTIHSSKGLEFNHVFIPSGADVIGFQRCKTEEERDEEVRLLYVAVTRAIQWCLFTYAEEDDKGEPCELSDLIARVV